MYITTRILKQHVYLVYRPHSALNVFSFICD